MRILSVFALLVWLTACDEARLYFNVEHSFDEANTWLPRGTLSLRNSNAFRLADSTKLDLSAKLEQKPFNQSDATSLQKLVQNGGYYYMRIQTEAGTEVLTSVAACRLVASDFTDSLVVHMDASNNICSLEYVPVEYTCKNKEETFSVRPFKTKVRLGTARKGPQPIMSVLHNQETKPAEDPADNQSFFSKYWYWFVGGAVFLVFQSLLVPPAEEGQGGGTGGGAKQKKN